MNIGFVGKYGNQRHRVYFRKESDVVVFNVLTVKGPILGRNQFNKIDMPSTNFKSLLFELILRILKILFDFFRQVPKPFFVALRCDAPKQK